ncbi:MAG: hypothetical protein Q9218_001579 [Villophora microphyllina]
MSLVKRHHSSPLPGKFDHQSLLSLSFMHPDQSSNTSINNDDVTDPYHLPVTGTPITLVMSGFSRPITYFTPLQIFDIGQNAQYDIVNEVVRGRGDNPIPAPNLEWCSSHGMRRICLRFNHKLDGKLTWDGQILTMGQMDRWHTLSAAIKGVTEFGWNVAFVTCKAISIYHAQLGVVGTAELGFTITEAAATDGMATT